MDVATSTSTGTQVDDRLRRARFAVAAVFLTNGALFANVVPRYPQIKAELGLNNAQLGTAIATFPLGALVGGLFAAPLITRFWSARLASGGIVVLAIGTLMVAFAPNGFALAAVLALSGSIDSIVDVAQNTHGLRVQRGYGRSIVNSFHGIWSIGAVTGGLMGSAAAGLDVPLEIHLGIAAVIFSTVAMVARHFMLPGRDDVQVADPVDAVEAVDDLGGPGSAGPSVGGAGRRAALRTLAILGVIAACAALVEDSGNSWGAIYLRDDIGTSAATAGLAFVAFQVAMTLGRLTGDRVTDRYGQRLVVRAGGLLAAVGMGSALAIPSLPATLIGFALAGLGVSTLIPAAMHAADELPGLAHGVGLSAVSWLLRVGFLISPPVVGLVADATSLRVGLLTVVVAGSVIILLGTVFPARRVRSAA